MLRSRCKHPEWDFLGETSESIYDWCPICGAIKRTREGVKIFLPQQAKVKKHA